jgi:hypothetical protein
VLSRGGDRLGVPQGREGEVRPSAPLARQARDTRAGVFIVPAEDKPVAVHFGSPALVGVLARAMRRATEDQLATFSITEMLPGPDRLWLRDKDDRHYTSELRFVAVDALHQDSMR